MKRSNRLVILVGVLLAVLAFVAIVILLNQREAEVAPEEVQQTVLVATRDIAIGDPVTPDDVEELEIDPEAVVTTPLGSTSAVSGQASLFAIPEGSQVTAEALGIGSNVTTNLAALLQPGEKAISFQVDRVTGLDFLVKPGDSIDIVFAGDVSVVQETADSAANPDPEAPPRYESAIGLDDQRTVRAILQDKRVLFVSATRAVEPDPVDADGDGVADPVQPEQAVIDSVIVVFAGTTADAEVIKFAQRDFSEIGFLTAIVRHPDDDAIDETALGITFDQLVEVYGVRVPDVVQQLTEEATTP